MSLDYLEDLVRYIHRGDIYFACQGQHSNQWHISLDLDEIKKRAQRTANTRKFEVNVYQMIDSGDVVTGDSYLVVRKILEPGPRGEPHLQWALVDTKEAAEMLRDVSQGPSPYFGATVEDTFSPSR